MSMADPFLPAPEPNTDPDSAGEQLDDDVALAGEGEDAPRDSGTLGDVREGDGGAFRPPTGERMSPEELAAESE